jgi:creatinine amidohydrolase
MRTSGEFDSPRPGGYDDCMAKKEISGPDMTAFEIKDAAPKTAVIGVGAFEQHSRHLPVDTDYVIASELSRRVAEKTGAFLLHALAYSDSSVHRGFAGTVYLRPLTLRSVIHDIGESLADWGVENLAIVNCHGGNFILNPAVREWNLEGRLPHMMHIEIFNALADVAGPNLHACELETSIMLVLKPDLVRMDRAVDFVPSQKRSDLSHFGMRAVTPEGSWGFPSRGNAENGRIYLDRLAEFGAAEILRLREGFAGFKGFR